MVKEADLFTEAQYDYVITIDYSSSKSVGAEWFESTLKIDEKNGTLFVTTDKECDDPGCPYFTDISVEVLKDKNNKPYIKLHYEGSIIEPEEPMDDTSFEGNKLFFKVK